MDGGISMGELWDGGMSLSGWWDSGMSRYRSSQV